jgi:hypothetical protein
MFWAEFLAHGQNTVLYGLVDRVLADHSMDFTRDVP